MNKILDSQTVETNKVFGKTNTFLLNSILALFHRGYLGSYDKTFIDSTIETLTLIKDPGLHFESTMSYANDILTGIISELTQLTEKPSPEWLEIRLKPLKVDHFDFIKVIITEFSEIATYTDHQIKMRYRIYRDMCDQYKEGFLVKSIAREMFGAVLNGDELLAKESMREALERITPLLGHSSGKGIEDIPGISKYVRSDDVEAIELEFKEAAELVDTRSVLRCGITDWDESLSDYGGMLRGCIAEMQSVSGGSKSDTGRSYLTGVARTTIPFMFDESKKPALVYLTLEDSLSRGLSRVLTSIRREEQDKYDVEEISEVDAGKLYKEYTGVNGYTIFNVKGKQKELTPRNVIAVLQNIIDDGYEIHLFVQDYMGLLSYTDIVEANNSEAIKTGYSLINNFCQENKIAAILMAQIAGATYGKVKDAAPNDGIRHQVEENLSSQSMNIINVLDIRIMVNVLHGPNGSYHQWAVGKNRVGTSLSPKQKYCVHKLHQAIDSRDGTMKPAGFIKVGTPSLRRTPDVGMDDEDESLGF